MNGETYNLNFGNLVGSIREIDEQLTAQAGRAVNVSLTIRNWLIGFYIREYEQNGADRAQYGESLLDRLSSELRKRGVSRSEARELRRYRLFYSTYPQIRETLTPEYALAGMDNHLFVSKYLLAMHKKEEIKRFFEEQIKPGV